MTLQTILPRLVSRCDFGSRGKTYQQHLVSTHSCLPVSTDARSSVLSLMAVIPKWLQPWSASSSQKEADVGASQAQSAPEQPFEQQKQQDLLASTLPTNDAATTLHTDDKSTDSSHITNEEYFYLHGPSLAIPMTGASLGFVSGFATSAKRAGLVFMAENTHRRPTTVQGWYFYNKTKNYKVLLAGALGGIRSAAHVALWTCGYVAVEEGVCRARKQWLADGTLESGRYALSTTQQQQQREQSAAVNKAQAILLNARWLDGATAGVTVASIGSALYRLPGPMTRRLIGLGAIAGASVGALRQVQGTLAQTQMQEAQKNKVEQVASTTSP